MQHKIRLGSPLMSNDIRDMLVILVTWWYLEKMEVINVSYLENEAS